VSVLREPAVSAKFIKNYVGAHVDLGEYVKGTPQDAMVQRHNSREYRPLIVFLDASGKEVARFNGMLKSKEDALLLDRFVSGKHYLKGDFKSFRAANS
jgi:hypothetical protein